jgi:hypothetical protein
MQAKVAAPAGQAAYANQRACVIGAGPAGEQGFGEPASRPRSVAAGAA